MKNKHPAILEAHTLLSPMREQTVLLVVSHRHNHNMYIHPRLHLQCIKRAPYLLLKKLPTKFLR